MEVSFSIYCRSIRVFLWLVFSVVFLTDLAFAQPQVLFRRYAIQDGLSHNYVRSVLQDSEGFIWVATEDGLNKFNSYTFRIYKNIPGDSTSITNHPIIDLTLDKHNNLWVATWGGGIFLYNAKLDNFKQFKHIIGKENSLASNYVEDLFTDSNGRLWIATNAGLNLFKPDKNEYTHFKHDPNDSTSLSHNRIMDITEDKHGYLWIATTGGGLNLFNPKTGLFQHYKYLPGDDSSLSSNDVYSVFYDSKERLWVGTWDAGLNLMKASGDGFVHFKSDVSISNSLLSNQIWAITEDPDGKIWIGTDKGLALYNDIQQTFFIYQNDPFDFKSLSGNSVKSLYIDKQGRLWVGTVNNGLCLFEKYLVQMGHYYRKLEDYSLSHNDVSAFLQDRSGQIFVGTDGGGLNLFDQQGNRFIHYKHDHLRTKSIGSDKIKAFLEDRKGRIWIGFWGSGFDYFDADKQTFTHFRKDISTETTLSNDNVTCLAEDQQGYLWLGTFGGGLNKFDPERKTFRHYTPDITKPNSLSDKNIWEVLVDTQNNIWVGTSNGQLNLFDRENEGFINIPLHTSEENSYAVQVLFEDSKQRIWIGLAGGGLKLLNKNTRTYTSFNQQNGLPATSINSIEESSNGDLWLSTNLGILHFNPQTKRCHIFGLGEGVQGLHFNRQASFVLSSGKMLFGGNNGFNLFHPDSLIEVSANVPVVFTDFQIFNQPVAIGKNGSPLKDQINLTQAINLSIKESVFSIEYAALSYTAPEKIAYQYRLKGFVDESWQKVGTTRKVTYTNLAPKQYEFEVRAMVGDNNLSPIRTLTITVIPPWWQTWLFKIFSACSALAFVFVWYKAKTYRIRERNKDLEIRVLERTNQIETQKQEIEAQRDNLNNLNLAISEKNEELEKKVAQRTRELQANNEELIKSNHQIKQSLQEKDVLLAEVHHRVKNNLAVISGLLQMQVFNTDNKQVHAILQDSQNRIKSMALIHEKLYQNGTFANIEFSTYIHDLIKEIEFSYPEKAEAVEVNVYLDKIFLELNTAIPCGLLINELLSNVYKHAFKSRNSGIIDITFNRDGEYYILKVSDNGVGLDPLADLQKASSLGIKLIQTLVKQLQGEMEFINNNGLTFILKFIPFKMKVWK